MAISLGYGRIIESGSEDCYNTDMKLRFEWTIPNILTLIRFLAIPVLAYLIFLGDAYNIVAFILFVCIWLTDMLDGYIARHYNQITEFGKLFDPLVDKVFQLTTAIMLAAVDKLPVWVPVFIFLKELLMIVGSWILLRKRELVVYAKWYGKVATILFVVAFACLFFLPPDQTALAGYIFIPPVVCSLYAYLRYGLDALLPAMKERKETRQP